MDICDFNDLVMLIKKAKFHKYQTFDMREAMKVYKKWLKLYGIKT